MSSDTGAGVVADASGAAKALAKPPGGMAMDWYQQLESEFRSGYMDDLRAYLKKRKQSKKVIYPHSNDWFNAFRLTPLANVRVVMLGQDPYHGPGQAHGLCFSVPRGERTPPSLQNIYKELASDLGCSIPAHGCLEDWASQGVFMLNSVLTVEAREAASHQGRGWEQFTDRVVEVLSTQCEQLVFLLWGSYAQKKGAMIDARRHLVLKAPHPSPLSAHRGFLGCQHFSQANSYLVANGKDPVNWQIS